MINTSRPHDALKRGLVCSLLAALLLAPGAAHAASCCGAVGKGPALAAPCCCGPEACRVQPADCSAETLEARDALTPPSVTRLSDGGSIHELLASSLAWQSPGPRIPAPGGAALPPRPRFSALSLPLRL